MNSFCSECGDWFPSPEHPKGERRVSERSIRLPALCVGCALDAGERAIEFRVIASFGGRVLSEHSEEGKARESATRESFQQPVDVWTTTGGMFGNGVVVAHFNEGRGDL